MKTNRVYIVGVSTDDVENPKDVVTSVVERSPLCLHVNLINVIGRSVPERMDVLRVVITEDEKYQESDVVQSFIPYVRDRNWICKRIADLNPFNQL